VSPKKVEPTTRIQKVVFVGQHKFSGILQLKKHAAEMCFKSSKTATTTPRMQRNRN
jgi:hypothetical protein